MTIGVAIVGCGLIGAKRAAALSPPFELVAVYDEVPERAAALAQSSGARRAESAEDALGAPDVGFAIVATPHDRLAPIAMTALDHGCDVLIEKPGASRLAPLVELRDRAAALGRLVRVGFNHRFHPGVLAMHERRDAYGPALNVRARYGHGGRLGYEKEWRAQRSVSGGGELIDQGLHLIDLTRFLVGEVELAFAELRTQFWPMEVEDNAYLALRAGDAFAWLHASWSEWKNLFSLELSLERAKLEMHGLGGSYGTERLTLYEMLPEMGPPVETSWEWPEADRSWHREMEDVVVALEGGSAVGAGIDDCIAAFTVVEEAYSR